MPRTAYYKGLIIINQDNYITQEDIRHQKYRVAVLKKEIGKLREPTNTFDDKAIEGMKELLAREQESLKRMLEEEQK